MKKFIYVFAASCAIFVFSDFTIKIGSKNDERIKETRDLPDFSGVKLAIASNVYLTQGSPQKVELEGIPSDLERITTNIENGYLKIGMDNWNQRIMNNVDVYITVPNIEYLSVSGSGDIMAQTDINTDKIVLNVSGSGKIIIENLTAENIDSHISGSGRINLNGDKTVESYKLKISGSGRLEAEDLEVLSYDVNISGSGNAKVYAVDKIKAQISGSGSVNYNGKPKLDVHISGSG